MPEILHTRDMEGTVRALAERYERVLVRAKTCLSRPIRLPRAALADLAPHVVLHPPAFNSERDAWNRDGGVLLYYREYRMYENIAAHHAQVIVECPLSLDFLGWMTESARELAVVYLPRNWREHEACVRAMFPERALCEHFYRIAQQGFEPSPGMRAAMGATEAGCLVSDVDMASALQVRPAQLRRIRNVMLRTRDWVMVNPIMLRIAPQERTLEMVYHWISRECPVVDGAHLLIGTKLAKAVRHWKVALRSLERCGAIARRDTLYFYRLDGLEPDWKKIERDHQEAKVRMTRLAEFVEGTPEFSPQASTSRRSSAPAGQSRSTSAA